MTFSLLDAMFSRPQVLSAADNLMTYLAEAVLPPMVCGSSAPPMPPEGHKAHLNHLVIRPEDYRSRFAKIVAPKSERLFDTAVLLFTGSITSEPLGLPNLDEDTGYAFTIPVPGFNVQPPFLPRPTNVQEVTPWVLALPLQTMTRALHVVFPEARQWDITYVNKDDPDAAIWNTLVWRKTPPRSQLETFWTQPTDPLEKCSVVFAIQPPWILTPQDFNSFLRCSSLPPFNAWEPDDNRPFTSAERLWGKLWDTCVRRSCHHWVLSTYWGWVFGAFSEGFTAGQVLEMKPHDAHDPTVLQCLVYHVASSMGLVEGSTLPQYPETLDEMEWNMDIPEASRDGDIEYPDSGSEWGGMDDEPAISAGVSRVGDAFISAWGSEQEFCPQPLARVARAGGLPGYRRVMLHPEKAARVVEWQGRATDSPPPTERSISPVASESCRSSASVYNLAMRAGSEIPEVNTVQRSGAFGIGGFLKTVVEQGPEEEPVD